MLVVYIHFTVGSFKYKVTLLDSQSLFMVSTRLHNIFKYPAATLKLKVPEWWYEAISILRNQKYRTEFNRHDELASGISVSLVCKFLKQQKYKISQHHQALKYIHF
jgi:hypothetical protein